MIRKHVIALAVGSLLATGAWAQQAAQPAAQDQSANQAAQGQAGAQDQSANQGQAGAAQGQSSASDQAQQSSARFGGGGAAETIQEAISNNPDKAFAAVLISHARLEKQASQLVAEKATDPQIKQLAQDNATALEQLSQKVQAAAQKEGQTVHPDQMLPRDEAVLTFMKQMSPDTLQRDYVFHEAGRNQSLLLFSQWAAANAKDADMKQAAQDAVSKLQERGQTIQQIAQGQISGGGGAQPAGQQQAPSGQQQTPQQ